MQKRNEMIQLANDTDHALEDALKLHGIEVAYDDLTDKQSEAWDKLQSNLNTMRGMIIAHVKE